MNREYFEILDALARQYGGLPKQAYINLISEHFSISETHASVIVESWLSQGGR